MKYIKGKVSMTEWGNIKDGANELLFETHGPNRAKAGLEAVVAINQHDELVAERDELVEQRDALVGACEALLAWNKPCESLFQPEHSKYVPITLPEVIKLADDALALVRGEVSE